jgi:hypothetical protein
MIKIRKKEITKGKYIIVVPRIHIKTIGEEVYFLYVALKIVPEKRILVSRMPVSSFTLGSTSRYLVYYG